MDGFRIYVRDDVSTLHGGAFQGAAGHVPVLPRPHRHEAEDRGRQDSQEAEFLIISPTTSDDIDLYVRTPPAARLVQPKEVGLTRSATTAAAPQLHPGRAQEDPALIRENFVRGTMGENTPSTSSLSPPHERAGAGRPGGKTQSAVQVVIARPRFRPPTGKTAIRFTLSDDGSVVRTTDSEKSLIDTILWKKAFRNLRR